MDLAAINEKLGRRKNELQPSLITFRSEQLLRRLSNDKDWLRAESEILHTIAVKTYEFDDMFITHAQVPVLTADEIQVSVERRRIIISDRDRPNILGPDHTEFGKRLLCTVVLPERVDWASAAMSFKGGTLEIEVPKLSAAESLTSD